MTIILAPFLLGLAMMPGLLLGAPAVWAARRSITVGVYFFGFLTAAYTYALISAWCGGVTFYFMKEATGGAFWPMLIWSYGLATSPWTYMAQKDQSITAFLAAFFAQVAYIVMMVAVAFGADLQDGMQAFALFMIVGVFFHMRLLAEMQRAGLLSSETVL